MKHWVIAIRLLLAINFLILTSWPLVRSAAAKLNCGPVTNRSSDLPRTKGICGKLAVRVARL